MTVEDCQGQRDEGGRGSGGWGEGLGGYSMWLIPSRRQESHCLSRDLKVCVCVSNGWGVGLNLSGVGGSPPHSVFVWEAATCGAFPKQPGLRCIFLLLSL